MAHVLLSNLGVVCGTCDALNAAGDLSCGKCGIPLGEAPVELLKPKASQRFPARAPDGSPPPVASMLAEARPPVAPAPARAAGGGLPPAAFRGPPAPAPLVQAAPPNLSRTPAPQGGARPGRPGVARAPAPPPTTAPAARPSAGSRFIVGVVAGPARGQRFRLMATGCSVGRSKGAILFPDDSFVSPQHAAFRVRDGALFIRDDASASGVYVSISKPELLEPGRQFCVGPRVFRYQGLLPARAPEPGRPLAYGSPVPAGTAQYLLEEMLVGGRPGRAVVIAAPLFTIGQGPCDLAFPNDAGLAARHCELSPSPAGATLRDLSGGLGTYVRMGSEELALAPGDRVRIGQQTLQVEVSV